MSKEISELDEILIDLYLGKGFRKNVQNWQSQLDDSNYKTDLTKAKDQILKLIQEARINELLGLKYTLNVDKDAYMHLILDTRIKTIEGLK